MNEWMNELINDENTQKSRLIVTFINTKYNVH